MNGFGFNPISREATIIVAANDSLPEGKARADYVCDGVWDEVEINAAINSLPATGGTVYLLEGTYNIGMPIYPKDYTRLVGQGKGTIIKVGAKVSSLLSANATASQITITVADTTGFRVGMDVTIFDDAHTGYGLGESNQITDINTDTKVLTLLSPLAHDYTTAQNAVIFSAYNAIDCYDKIHVTIEKLTIDGNKTNNSRGNYDEWQNGIYLNNSHYAIIRDCHIYDCIFAGILSSHHVDGSDDGSIQCVVCGNFVYGCGLNAMHFHGLQKSIISGNICEDGSQSVIYFMLSNDNQIIENTMANGNVGLMMLASNRNCITGGNIVTPTTQGIALSGSFGRYSNYNVISGVCVNDSGGTGIGVNGNHNIVSECIIYSPGEIGISLKQDHCVAVGNLIKDSSGTAILTYAATTYCTITGNVIDRTQWGSAISIGGLNTIVTDNIIHSTSTAGGGPFVTSQTDTVVRNNIGFKTENSGTAIIANGTTSIVVSHGLDVTPTADDISVTPTNNLGTATKFWVDTLTSTQFTIHVDADPGVGTATFAWKAIVL